MNIPELNAAIARIGVSRKRLATELGISRTCMYNKLCGTAEFKGSEIKTLAQILCLSATEVNEIFFDIKVN